MEEIYWITRLDNVKVLLTIIIAISFFICIMSGILYTLHRLSNHTFIEDATYEVKLKLLAKYIKVSATVFTFTMLLDTFVPSSKELCAIYGVGGAVEYLKSNDTAKQLPDKFIKVLDVLATEYLKDLQDEKTSN